MALSYGTEFNQVLIISGDIVIRALNPASHLAACATEVRQGKSTR